MTAETYGRFMGYKAHMRPCEERPALLVIPKAGEGMRVLKRKME